MTHPIVPYPPCPGLPVPKPAGELPRPATARAGRGFVICVAALQVGLHGCWGAALRKALAGAVTLPWSTSLNWRRVGSLGPAAPSLLGGAISDLVPDPQVSPRVGTRLPGQQTQRDHGRFGVPFTSEYFPNAIRVRSKELNDIGERNTLLSQDMCRHGLNQIEVLAFYCDNVKRHPGDGVLGNCHWVFSFGDVVRRLLKNLRTGWTAALVAAASWSGLGSIAPQPGFHGYSKVPFSQGFPNEINAREPSTHQMLCLNGLLTTSMCGGVSHE